MAIFGMLPKKFSNVLNNGYISKMTALACKFQWFIAIPSKVCEIVQLKKVWIELNLVNFYQKSTKIVKKDWSKTWIQTHASQCVSMDPCILPTELSSTEYRTLEKLSDCIQDVFKS